MDAIDRIRVAEHRIREILLARPGMRVGRVLRRMYPSAADDQIQSLASAWDNGWDVETLGASDDWVPVMQECRSCMSADADSYRDAWTSRGVQLLVLAHNGKPVARQLVSARQCSPRSYGPSHHVLQALVRVVCGLRSNQWSETHRAIHAEKAVWFDGVRLNPRPSYQSGELCFRSYLQSGRLVTRSERAVTVPFAPAQQYGRGWFKETVKIYVDEEWRD